MKHLIVLLCLFPLLALSHSCDSKSLGDRLLDFVSGGCPIPKSVALAGVKNLENSLRNEDLQREAIQQEDNDLINKATIPLLEIALKDNRSRDAVKKLLKGRSHSFQGTTLQNVTLPRLESGITSGSVVSRLTPAYPLVWTASSGNGRATAKQNGEISVVADEPGWASGGVAVHFRPQKVSEIVKFSHSSSFSWRWRTRDCWFCSTSRTHGFIGIFIQQFDLVGNHIRDFDFRQALWNKGGVDIGGVRFTDPPMLALSSNNVFTVWVWFQTAASGHDAFGEINANVGAIVIEEFT